MNVPHDSNDYNKSCIVVKIILKCSRSIPKSRTMAAGSQLISNIAKRTPAIIVNQHHLRLFYVLPLQQKERIA